MIAVDTQQVEYRRRTADKTWETVVYQAGEPIALKSLELEFDIAELYRGLDG